MLAKHKYNLKVYKIHDNIMFLLCIPIVGALEFDRKKFVRGTE